jgi:hypothetical protein
VVWLLLAGGGRRPVEVGLDPPHHDPALAKWGQLRGPTPRLPTSLYPARPDAGPPNPVFGLPDLEGDPTGALATHLVDQHGIAGDTTQWLADHEGLVGLVGEHDLDHTEPADTQLGHSHPGSW